MGECLIVRKGSQPEGTATTGDVISGVTFQSANSDDLQTGTLSLSGTADTANVLSGKTFYNTNAKSKQTGTMADRGQAQYGKNIGVSGDYCHISGLPEGYYHADGEAWAPEARIAKTSLGNASAWQVLSGATFSSQNGVNVTGAMTNNGAVSATISAGGSYTIPSGYHNGSGKVSATATLKAEKLAESQSASSVTLSKYYYAIIITISVDGKRSSAGLPSINVNGLTLLASASTGNYGYNSYVGKDNDYTTITYIYGSASSGHTISWGSASNGWGHILVQGITI